MITNPEEKALMDAAYANVVKANALIQRTRFSLTAQEQKIILYLISKINQYDKELKTYKFYIPEFCRLTGIQINGGNYSSLKRIIKQLRDKSFWITTDDNTEILMSWISGATIRKNSGILEIRLNPDLAPYLVNLKKNYTRWELIYSLSFKSKYSLRLYEILKSVQYNDLKPYSKTFDIENLKMLLDAEKYDRYFNFDNRVLQPAVEEINLNSDKTVSYTPKKERYSNKYSKIEFLISSKSVDERLSVGAKLEKELSLIRIEEDNQLSLFESEEI